MAQLKNMTAGVLLPLASPPASVRSYDILTYSKGKVEPAVFLSCREQTLTMHVNGVPFVRVACSGQHLQYLVPGFLYSCGVINSLRCWRCGRTAPAARRHDAYGREEVRVDRRFCT